MPAALAQPGSTSLRQWRVTTAARVFTLALAFSGAAVGGGLGQAAPAMAALGVIAGVACALEWGTPTVAMRLVPLGEALLAALLLMSTAALPPSALAYLAVPPVVAGMRFGFLPATNATFLGFAACLITLFANSELGRGDRLATASVWLAAGWGASLLASWQLRSVRDDEARQAPYAAANQLLSQLRHLAERGHVGLDSAQIAAELEAALRAATGAEQSAVFVNGRRDAPDLLVSRGDVNALHALLQPKEPSRSDVARLLVGSVESRQSTVLLVRADGWDDALLRDAQRIVDDHSLRLDTAVLFDRVRMLAVAEERNRIAREMHDGVAQEIVALGYVVDEIETLTTEHETRQLAASLREEITRVVTELRLSIFDLRHHISEHRLSGALADYARELSHGTELRVHLVLDESGPPLPSRTEVELLRIAQEAIGNVRKHSQADNVWVTLASAGSVFSLTVEDDGIGNAAPRKHHWGLQSMRERAERIGTQLTISPRAGGGTIVHLEASDNNALEGTAAHDNLRASD